MSDSFSSADEIKKMKDLLDSGAITQAEFDKHKAKLLGLGTVEPPTAPSTATPPVAPSPAPKKKRRGCLIPTIIILGFCCFLVTCIVQLTSSPEKGDSAPISTLSPEEQQSAWLEFDAKSWDDFTNLYKNHNSLMTYVDAFSNLDISAVDLYAKCTEFEEYFRKASSALNYATTDDEKTYLSALETAALSDQMIARDLKAYLDSEKTSDLAKVEEQIKIATTAYTTVARNRGVLLVKAGLTDEEIKAKVEADVAALG